MNQVWSGADRAQPALVEQDAAPRRASEGRPHTPAPPPLQVAGQLAFHGRRARLRPQRDWPWAGRARQRVRQAQSATPPRRLTPSRRLALTDHDARTAPCLARPATRLLPAQWRATGPLTRPKSHPITSPLVCRLGPALIAQITPLPNDRGYGRSPLLASSCGAS
jgi:hypothetical protein